MAYTVNWIAKVISIPSSDLELVSGTRYRLNMSGFLSEIRRLEADPAGGLWAEQILDHTNGKQNFAGADYAPFDEIINGYTVQFTGSATRVDLVGSNNNLIDVLVATGVSVVPSNSAGLQTVNIAGGSGATAAEVWSYGTRTLTSAAAPTAEENAAAVWSHATGASVAVRMAEAWGRLGLDASKPLVSGQTSITFGDIVMALTGNEVTSTLTRQ